MDDYMDDYFVYRDFIMSKRDNIYSINIADRITYIGSTAFSGCPITDIKLPKSVISIGDHAFYDCTSLINCQLDGVKEIGYQAFYCCTSLSTVTLPDTLRTIDMEAFCNCNISELAIPEGTLVIEDYAFADNASLKKIILPKSVSSIGETVFNNCPNVVIYGYRNTVAEAYAKDNNISFVALDDEEDIRIRNTYELFDLSMTWDEAKAYCENRGGHLCTITSAKELAFILPLVKKSTKKNLWLGAELVSDNFVWITGEPFSYTNWNNGEPNNVNDTQNAIMMYTYSGKNSNGYAIIPGMWNDENKNGRNWEGYRVSDTGFICEYEKQETGNTYTATMTQYTTPVNVGDELLFNVVIRDSNGNPVNISDLPTEPTYTVSVSDTKCIRIDDKSTDLTGAFIKATAIGEGTATVTVTFSNGVSATSTVKVGKSEIGDTYNVTWVNDDGTTIYTEEMNVGEHPTYNAEKWGFPVSSTGNEFKGWANIPETENNIVIPVFSSTDISYTGNGGDITYYAIYGDFVNVKWYNGNTLLEEKYCKENTVPTYSGNMPKCYDYEYGLVREFLGWTTADNRKYDITIPDGIKPIKQDTVYYAVFSDKDPDVNVTTSEVYDIHYINQHIESANNRLWDIASLSSQNKVAFESSPTEFANGLWSGTEVTVDLINLDIFGLVDKVSANDYNIIMLDMFASVENMELAEKTLNDSILKAVKENTKFLKQICSVEKLMLSDHDKILKDIDFAYNSYLKAVETSDPNGLYNYCISIQDIIKKYNLEDVDISEVDNVLKPYHAFNEINDVIGDISTVVGTFKSYSDNMVQIISSQAYIHMDDVYRELLVDMYYEAAKYDGNSWEIMDLRNAIVYALNYNENYKRTAILSTINGTSYELAKLIFGANALDKPNSLNKESVSKRIQSFFVNKGTDFVNKTFGSTFDSKIVGGYFKAIQVGSKLGMYISDSLFSTSSRHDMYIKIKEYGVLEDVMKSVLNKRATELLNATSLKAQHNAAQKYDKAYKMYLAIEIMGSDNIAAYEKSLIPSSVSAAIQKWMGADTIYKVLYNESLDKAILRHTANYTDYKNYSESLSKYPCHNDIFINENNYIDIMLKYNMHIENYKISIISCPVNVLVYNENKQLVGNLSSSASNVKKGYEIYMYRIDETDSSVVIVPSNYSIEIVGLDDGMMTLIGGYCKNGELVNAVSYNNVPINNNYAAKFDIDENTSNLSDITPTSPSQPILSVPTTNNNSNQENTNTYDDVSSGAGIYELFEDKKEPFCMIVIIIAAVGFSTIIIVKRFAKNKR